MSIFLMGSGEWGLGTGDWGSGSGESGMGSREWGVGSRCRDQLSAIRLPLSEFAYRFLNDLNNRLGTRESGIGNLTADSW